MIGSFQQKLKSALKNIANDFVVTFELVPARASKGKAQDRILQFAKDVSKARILSALSITDNAGGHPALSPKALGREIMALGMEPIIHFSCKDKNRNLIESELFELDRLGIKNLLVITGDYPRYGIHGNAKPVFDLDSVQVLSMISDMNQGIVLDPKAPGGGVRLAPTDFHPGCVVSPFKRLEGELIPQYQKLKLKIRAGARYVITQMGYDARKYDELRRFMRLEGLKIPLIGTVFVPNLRLARLLNQGVVPGCILPGGLLEKMEEEAKSSDGGENARLERAARLVAILKGLGYEGVHLSGSDLTYLQVAHILKRAQEIYESWPAFVKDFLFPEEWNFYYFLENPKTGLNFDTPSPSKLSRISPMDAFSFLLGKGMHSLFFEKGKGFYETMSRFARKIDGSSLDAPIASMEYIFKRVVYECQKCGDCTLGEMAFLCPQSKCAKFLLNGPCGGSRDGWCEVWPGVKRCIYVRVYERLEKLDVGYSKDLQIIPPRNWALYCKSSWINYYLERDHSSLTYYNP